MKFTISRNSLLQALQKIHSLLIKQDNFSILENILIKNNAKLLSLTAINLEIEIIIKIPIITSYKIGSTTVSGRKMFNIFRRLSNNTIITIETHDKNLTITTMNSCFSLMTLSPQHFPNLCDFNTDIKFDIPIYKLKKILNLTYFSMANNDVRYYLNGMLFEINNNNIRSIATDGYRMAIYNMPINILTPPSSFIIPRKTVIELIRLLDDSKCALKFLIDKNKIRIQLEKLTITSKLIEGSFPDYQFILLKNPIKMMEINIELLKEALLRVSILSNEKFHAVHFFLKNNQLELSSKNKNETAKETIHLTYSSNMTMEIDINVNYILDVLNVLNYDKIIFFTDPIISKIQLKTQEHAFVSYIIMPLRL